MLIKFPLHRTFLALPLTGKAKHEFQALQESLQEFEQIMRFQHPETPHITLFFWPEVMELEMQGIVGQAEKIASANRPFKLKTIAVETFTERGEDRVLFLKLAFSEELGRIKKMIPWTDRRPFSPHITLARIKHPQRFRIVKKQVMKILKKVEFEIPVDRIRLYAEVEGKKQTPLQDFVF